MTALLVRGNDGRAAALGGVRFRPVNVASTNGAMVSLTYGLQPGQRIANVPHEVTDGSRIQPIKG